MKQKNQTRREFIKTGLAGSLVLATGGIGAAAPLFEDPAADRGSVRDAAGSGKSSITTFGDTSVKIFSDKVKEPVKLLLLADTHIWMSDSREDPFRKYSSRMAGAYNTTRDFRTLQESNPCEEFEKTLALAAKVSPDAILLLGDIVSYPTEAGIEWVKGKLDATGIPWYYTTGNHDWHYEGMEGTEIALREEWTSRRLAPLYKGRNHLLYSVGIKGVKVLMLDNSVYEILPEQLDIFRKEMKEGLPSVMMSHIPFYAPGFSVGYGCGHPDWNAEHDNSYELERRPRWPVAGHSGTTYAFWKEVQKSHRKNGLLATFAGHVHSQSSSQGGGWPQFTLKANFSGAYTILEILPAEKTL